MFHQGGSEEKTNSKSSLTFLSFLLSCRLYLGSNIAPSFWELNETDFEASAKLDDLFFHHNLKLWQKELN